MNPDELPPLPELTERTEIGTEQFEKQKAALLKELANEPLIEAGTKKVVKFDDIGKERNDGAKELFASQNIDLKTQLTPKEARAGAQCHLMADRYKINALREFVEHYFRNKVSLERKGRKEYIQGLHAEERRVQGADLSPLQALLGGAR